MTSFESIPQIVLSLISIANEYWSALASIIVSPMGVIVYCLFIFIICCYWISQLWSKISPAIKQLKETNQRLKTIQGREEFANKYYEFDQFISEQSVLCNGWREFTEALLFPDVDFDDKAWICKTRRLDQYFSKRKTLSPLLSLRFYNSVPNILTGLGILGTFVGLVAGISLAAPGLNSSEIQGAKAALENLLSGASLAFTTSIFGLALSMVFSGYEKHKVHEFDQLLNTFHDGLEERLEYVSSEKINSRLFMESQKQTDSLESFSNDLAVSLGDLIANKITEPMNATMVDLGEIMKEQKLILEGLRADQQKASDETLERLINEFSTSISGAAGKEMKAFAETIVQLSEKLDQQIATMAQSQADMQQSSEESVQKLQDSFHENTQHLQNEVASAITTMVDGVKNTMGEMTQMLKEATVESASNMRTVSEQFRGSIDALQSTVESMSQKLQEATDASARNMQNIAQQFESSITTLKETVNDMAKINKNTQNILDEVDDLISVVDQYKNELIKASTPIQKATGEMVETSNNIKSAAEIMNDASTRLQDNVTTIKETHDYLKSSWKTYEERFEGVDSSLAAIFKELEQGLATYASSTKGYVEQLDQHASQVVTHLAGASSELREDIEMLGDVLDSLRKFSSENEVRN